MVFVDSSPGTLTQPSIHLAILAQIKSLLVRRSYFFFFFFFACPPRHLGIRLLYRKLQLHKAPNPKPWQSHSISSGVYLFISIPTTSVISPRISESSTSATTTASASSVAPTTKVRSVIDEEIFILEGDATALVPSSSGKLSLP